ncbi:MAG: SBBP repeat-containing protein [Deltaproteobacteria bacterium]|nr:SBBP repeat-containing protein [Deltaproteobacteria bacterium]
MKNCPIILLFLAGLYACSSDGKDGAQGNSSLVELTDEAAGENCENGGVRIDSGLDLNRNGILETEEILSTRFVCSSIGQDGSDGNSVLVELTDEAAGENCENGGVRIDSGIDDNEDGFLDSSEVDVVRYICDGTDGNIYDALVTVNSEPLCLVSGSERIDIGFDLDGNGNLEQTEITGTSYTNCPSGPVGMFAQWGTVDDEYGHSVAVDGSGNIYVTGYTNGELDSNTSVGSYDIFLTKYSADGTKQWTQQWGTSGDDAGRGVAVSM